MKIVVPVTSQKTVEKIQFWAFYLTFSIIPIIPIIPKIPKIPRDPEPPIPDPDISNPDIGIAITNSEQTLIEKPLKTFDKVIS